MNKTAQFLSKKEKIQKLSDEAIEDIYSRQLVLKIAKNRKGYIKQDSKLFKGLNLENGGTSLYEAIRNFDIQLFHKLDKKDCSIEEAIIKEFTKDTSQLEDSKTDIMRYKLEKTSECCGVPKAVLVHKNIESWSELEEVRLKTV